LTGLDVVVRRVVVGGRGVARGRSWPGWLGLALACVALLSAFAVLVLATEAQAASSRLGPAATSTRAVRSGRIVVVVVTPAGVSANVLVRARRMVRVLAKAPGGRSQSFSLRVPAGVARVSASSVVLNGSVYAADASSIAVVVRVGKSARATMRFGRLAVASGLRVVNVTAGSAVLEWSPAKGSVVRLRRAQGPGAPASPSAGVAVRTGYGSATDTGLAAGMQYSYYTRYSRGRRGAGLRL
jgi:hypothetical protein